ncbi:MAG: ROK family protein [Blautia sp.]|jgi:predicted NBD/HSP70 family sugar kinase
MDYYVSMDIGGTSIKYGVIREDAEIVFCREMPTKAMEEGGPGIVRKAKEIVRECMKKYPVRGIGISTAGMVDCETGVIFDSAPLIPDYAGTQMKAILEGTFGIPCEVENDVNCAGLAECVSGAGKGRGICLCLTIGTGIGGCIVMNGRVYHGYSSSACEVGYMHMDGGEYQALGSAKAMVRRVEERKGLKPGALNGKIIFKKAIAGDEDCIAAIDDMVQVISKGIANICYVLNPEMVILGGGIMAQEAYLAGRIRNAVDSYLVPSIAKKTTIAFAKHKNEAGMLGAFYHYQSRHPE